MDLVSSTIHVHEKAFYADYRDPVIPETDNDLKIYAQFSKLYINFKSV